MKKLPIIFLGAALALTVLPLGASAQTPAKPKVDLSGTWIGFAVIENGATNEGVTLVLENKDAGYAGKLTSVSGLATDSEIRKVVFKDGKLTFEFDLAGGQGEVIFLELAVEGDAMKGTWVDAGGNGGKVELERKK